MKRFVFADTGVHARTGLFWFLSWSIISFSEQVMLLQIKKKYLFSQKRKKNNKELFSFYSDSLCLLVYRHIQSLIVIAL